MSSHSIPTRRGGFSLIEVAIALAIFVFGALAIVQIFPPALGVIRNNESRVTATQLSESMLARSTGKNERVPDAVYDIATDANDNPILDSDGNLTWVDTPYAVNGTASRNGSLPKGATETDFRSSALNHFKYIRGEKQIVRNGEIEGEAISFVLLSHPYYYDPSEEIINVYEEGVIEGARIKGNGELDLELASELLQEDKTYYVSYRWQEGGAIHGVIDEPFRYTSFGGSGYEERVLQGWKDTTDNRILAGNITLRYRKELDLPVSSFSDEEQELLANLGILIVPNSSARTLSIDYVVQDWRVLVNESRPDTSGIVSLPVKNLFSGESGVGALDLSFEPDNNGLNLSVTSPTLSRQSAKDGVLDYGQKPDAVTRRARVTYRAMDGWAQQLSVAAKSYIPFYADDEFPSSLRPHREQSLPREPWREYLQAVNELIFHTIEAGKSISVSYVNNLDEIVDVVLTIDRTELRDGISDEFFLLNIADQGDEDKDPNWDEPKERRYIAPVTITDLQGDAADVKSILSVKGLSVQARTAWQDGGGRYHQVIVPGYRTLLR